MEHPNPHTLQEWQPGKQVFTPMNSDLPSGLTESNMPSGWVYTGLGNYDRDAPQTLPGTGTRAVIAANTADHLLISAMGAWK